MTIELIETPEAPAANVFALPQVVNADSPDAEVLPEHRAKYLPKPTGYNILCAIPKVEGTFEGTSIMRADVYARQEEIATTVLFVMDVGDTAYMDKDKFPNGAWCKKGDFVLVRTYAGTRLKIFGEEFRLIHDDQVEAVVEDPRGISRATV